MVGTVKGKVYSIWGLGNASVGDVLKTGRGNELVTAVSPTTVQSLGRRGDNCIIQSSRHRDRFGSNIGPEGYQDRFRDQQGYDTWDSTLGGAK